MSNYVLYGRSETGSDVVEYLFHEFNIDYNFIHVDEINVKTNQEILKHNPLGRVPMIKLSNGQYMIESMNIVYHLVNKGGRLVPKSNSIERDKFNQFMSFLSSSVYPIILLIYHPDHYTSKNSESNLIHKAEEIINTYLKFIDASMNKYLCGNYITAADYYLYMLLAWLDEDGYLNGYEKINSFFNKMSKNQTILAVKRLQNEREKK